jgi:hypothetical protein
MDQGQRVGSRQWGIGGKMRGPALTGAKKENSSRMNADLNMCTEKVEKGKRRILIKLTEEHGNTRI